MRFRLEPTAWIEAFRSVMFAIVLLGYANWTEQEQLAVIAAVSAILAAINRSVVTPAEKP